MRRFAFPIFGAVAVAAAVIAAAAIGGASTAAIPQPPAPQAQLRDTTVTASMGYRIPDSEVKCAGFHVSASFTIDAYGDPDPRTPEQVITDVAKRHVPDRDRLMQAVPYRAFTADDREVIRQVVYRRPTGTTAALFTMVDIGNGHLVLESFDACA